MPRLSGPWDLVKIPGQQASVKPVAGPAKGVISMALRGGSQKWHVRSTKFRSVRTDRREKPPNPPATAHGLPISNLRRFRRFRGFDPMAYAGARPAIRHRWHPQSDEPRIAPIYTDKEEKTPSTFPIRANPRHPWFLPCGNPRKGESWEPCQYLADSESHGGWRT
jgi:hypothetical protein